MRSISRRGVSPCGSQAFRRRKACPQHSSWWCFFFPKVKRYYLRDDNLEESPTIGTLYIYIYIYKDYVYIFLVLSCGATIPQVGIYTQPADSPPVPSAGRLSQENTMDIDAQVHSNHQNDGQLYICIWFYMHIYSSMYINYKNYIIYQYQLKKERQPRSPFIAAPPKHRRQNRCLCRVAPGHAAHQ